MSPRATTFVNPKTVEGDLVAHLHDLTDGGAGFTFEAVGSTQLMRMAFDSARHGWGVCTVIGMAPDGETISIPPLSLIVGEKNFKEPIWEVRIVTIFGNLSIG